MRDDAAIVFFAVWLTSVIVGAIVGAERARAGAGFAYALFLGPFGVIVAALLPNLKREREEADFWAKQLLALSAIQRQQSELIIMTGKLVTRTAASGGPKKINSFFYASDGKTEGPVTADDIAGFIEAGVIKRSTPVCREGEKNWKTGPEFPEIADLLA